jgi:CubicO group peptidase (beta-lactamase class C family)
MIEINTPESVGMSSSRVNEIDTAMQALVDQGKYAGFAALIARRGKVVHFGCYGQRDLAANRPVQPDTIFRIYSLTKPITAVASLMLVEEGRFKLDDPVAHWIPAFKNLRVFAQNARGEVELRALETELTFWHLLTHTSGLCYGFFTDTPVETMYKEAKLLSPIHLPRVPLPDLVTKIAALPLAFQPGAAWHYSLAHDVLGYLIEVISGQPFAVFLRERIFEPLGMYDTGFFVPLKKLDRFGPLYSAPEDDGLSIIDDVIGSQFVHSEVIPSGGGGLVSTMSDCLRFLLALANDGAFDDVRLLKSSTVKTMTTNQLTGPTFPIRFNDDEWSGMGFGLGLGVEVDDNTQDGMPPGVFGWIGVPGNAGWVNPHDEMLILVMANSFHYHEAGVTLRKMAYEAIRA